LLRPSKQRRLLRCVERCHGARWSFAAPAQPQYTVEHHASPSGQTLFFFHGVDHFGIAARARVANREARLAGFVGTFEFALAEFPTVGQEADPFGPGDLLIGIDGERRELFFFAKAVGRATDLERR
jgi:hypothetical protein